jgi:RimJ/RimL family protein N-acetyltransferase
MAFKPVILEDDRVLLRPIQLNDVPNLLPFALSEPDIWTYSLISAAGEAGMEAYVQTAIHDMTMGHSLVFIVYDKWTNQYVGSTRFYDLSPQYRTCSIGYTWYAGSAQGSGLNAHCKFLMLQHAFEDWGMARVEFRADERNKRSVAAMKKIGCVEEGTLRNHLLLPNGDRRSSVVLSILDTEWLETVKARLQRLL